MPEFDPSSFFVSHRTLYRLSLAMACLSLLSAIRRVVRAPTRARRLVNGLLAAIMAIEVTGLLRLQTGLPAEVPDA